MSDQGRLAGEARPIIIVDDDIDHAVIMRTVLSMVAPAADVSVVTDTRDVDAQLLRAPEGAVVFMDRMLPGGEAFPVVAAVTSARPDLRITLLSAALDDVDRDRALRAGAVAGVEKPGSLDGWRALFAEVLGGAAGETSSDDAVA